MKKFSIPILTLLALFIVTGCEKISTQMQPLDGVWLLKYDSAKVGLKDGWFDNEHDRSGWQETRVPGHWGDHDYDGFAWYATELSAKNTPAGYNLALVFDMVDDNAVVWLDGRLFGNHVGYGIKFFYDIGDRINDGKTHKLVIRIEDTGGPGGIPGAVYLQPYIHEVDLLRNEASKKTAPAAPTWVKEAAIYEVFVRNHTKEGTFKALEADLDRIKELGVDILWLMPIHPIGEKNRKGSVGSPYSVKDYYQVHPDLGSLEDFKSLVTAVHERGMHIILDFVLNHTAWDNPLMDQHPDWYSQDHNGAIIPPNTDWSDVADLNYDSPQLRAYMLKMLQWWITETDIDGYRFDVAELVPNDFWAAAKTACQEVKDDVFFLAEGKEPELHLHGHDMTYSWNIWEGLTNIAAGSALPSQLKKSYEMEAFQYPKGALRMRFSENHDKTPSSILFKEKALNKTAWAFVALMDGNPLIYAGQEMGNRQVPQPALFEKMPLKWDRRQGDIASMMSELLALRKQHLKHDSAFTFVIADDERNILAYKHGPLLNFFNFSDKPFKFSAKGMDQVLHGGLQLDADSTLTLPAWQYGVIR